MTFPGVIYTARDAADERLIEMRSRGEALPIDLRGDLLEAGKAQYRTSARPIPAVRSLGG